jgi:hypothetical protein
MARPKPGVSELIHQWHQGRGTYGSDGVWDVTRRYRRFARSLKSGAATARGDGDTQAQYRHYQEARERMRARLQQVKQLLYKHPVLMCNIVTYCNFARHVDRVCREHDAATRRHLVHMALDRWCAKGLDREVLLVIAEEVFGVRL